MNEEYLASGFARVDGVADKGFYSRCLSLIDSLPYYKRCKEAGYGRLGLRAGLSVLDVGCGLGDDAFRMAHLVSPGGRAVGVDSSEAMIAGARARDPGSPARADLLPADARKLPFCSGEFDRARIDRVLQHIANPENAIAELHRVLRPGGLAVAYDNDWGTFSISSQDPGLTRMAEDEWRYSFTNPWTGRHLRRLFARHGFADVEAHPSVSVITDFEVADQVYNLRKTVDRLVASSRATRSEGEDWIADLLLQSQEGCFQCSLTAYMVAGRKPEAENRG